MTVVLVDDHLLFAEALSGALERAGLAVVGIATSGAQGVAMVDRRAPDAVLLDLVLPDADGIDVGAAIVARRPDAVVIALSGGLDPAIARRARRVGFRACVEKTTRLQPLVRAVARVVGGGRAPSRIAHRPTGSVLTEREREVLTHLARGASGARIAEDLGIRPNTVRCHVQNILTKLQAHSRMEAVVIGIRRNLIEAPATLAPVAAPLVRGA